MCRGKLMASNNCEGVEIDNNYRQLCVNDKRVPIKCSKASQNIVLASIETSHATSTTRFSSRKLQVTNDVKSMENDDSNQSNESVVHATVDKIETVSQDVKCCVTAWKIGQDIWLLKHKVTTGIYDQIRILRAELHQGSEHGAPGVSTQSGGEIRIKKDITVWHEIWIYYLGVESDGIKEFYQQFKTTDNNVWKENIAEKPTADEYSQQPFQEPLG